MNLNLQIFHDFFHSDKLERRAKSHTRYERGHFFSYNTEIGHIYHAEHKCVLFISDYRFSSTTAGHRSALLHACPLDFVCVPFEWGDDFTQYDDIYIVSALKSRFVNDLQNFNPENFSRKASRDEFNGKLYNFRKFLDITGQIITLKIRRALEELEAAAADTPEMQARRAELARKKAEKTRKENAKKAKELEKALKIYDVKSLTDKAKFVYAAHFNVGKVAPEIRAKLKALLNKEYPGYSFIWSDGELIRTSQHVALDLDTARRVYSLFTAGKLTPGMHCGPYSIREITAEYVQIGCHRIAMENIKDIFQN